MAQLFGGRLNAKFMPIDDEELREGGALYDYERIG